MALTRRDFLRMAGLAAAGAACGSGGERAAPARRAAVDGRRNTLRIAQWSHFVPAYDQWFDNEYTRRWGEDHDVDVVVDHIPADQLRERAEAEVSARRGHDIFIFVFPPSSFEEHVVDHREIVEEAKIRIGAMAPAVERSVVNPLTGKYFAFPEYWVPTPVHYRSDLWGGTPPTTWTDVLRQGPGLKAAGHPVGMGLSKDIDANGGLLSLMFAHGSSLQDEAGNVTINTPATVEAVKVGAELFRGSMTDEVLGWDAASDNRLLASGKASFILDAVSALRAVEKQDPDLATRVGLAPVPAGPAGRVGPVAIMSTSVIWNFSMNQDAAREFLIDLAVGYEDAFVHSEFYNLPAFPEAVKDVAGLLGRDGSGKYTVLAEASGWTANVGHPGHDNAAIEEIFNEFLIPQMFAAAAKGEMTAAEAVAAAEAQMKPIFEKWRERGRV